MNNKKNIQKQFYSFNDMKIDLYVNRTIIKDLNFDSIVAISRGGMTFAHLLSQIIDIRDVYTINSKLYNGMNKNKIGIDIFNIPEISSNKKNILIVDDIVDSGETMINIHNILSSKYPDKKFTTISIFQNMDSPFKSDIFFRKKNSDWIDFFWEL